VGTFRLLPIFAILAGASAQPRIDVGEILGNVAATYAAPQRYEFVIRSTSQWPAENRSSAFFVHVAAQKPDRVRMQMSVTGGNAGSGQNPDDAITIADGENTWVYSPKQKQYTKRKGAGAAALNPIEDQLFNRYRNAGKAASRARLLRQESIESDGRTIPCYVVEIVNEPKSEFLIWWIDEARYIVLREDLEQGPGRPNEPVTYRESAVYTVARINEPLSPDLFVFIPPPGAKME